MSQHRDIAAIIRNKLRDALAKIDEATHNKMRAHWSAIGPAPACPHIKDLMHDMHQAQAAGLVERNRVAKEAVLEALEPIKVKLTERDITAVMIEVRTAFPESTTYVRITDVVPGIYQRRQAPAHKFQQRIYNTETALMRAGSTNMARRAITEIQHALTEVLIQQRILKPSLWQRARSIAVWIIVRPIIWLGGIVAAAAAAILTDWFKFLLGHIQF